MENNKIEKMLNLDCREEADQQVLQKVLHNIKPLAKFDGKIPQSKIEKLLGLICRRYYVDVKIIPVYIHENVDIYHNIVTTGITKLVDVYGCSIYEVLAKTVIWLFNAIKNKELERRN